MQKEITVSVLEGAETSRKQELLQYRADHCTRQRSDYFIMIYDLERNTHNIQIEEPQNETVMKSFLSRRS